MGHCSDTCPVRGGPTAAWHRKKLLWYASGVPPCEAYHCGGVLLCCYAKYITVLVCQVLPIIEVVVELAIVEVPQVHLQAMLMHQTIYATDAVDQCVRLAQFRGSRRTCLGHGAGTHCVQGHTVQGHTVQDPGVQDPGVQGFRM